jgi:hypothetical protein
MRVELLWWEGCPSTAEALEDVRRVLREEGVDAEPEMVEVTSDEQAREERFPGSPTIRIDGEEAIPAEDGEEAIPAEDGEPFSLTCRIYRLRDGRVSPTPDPEDLREAIRRSR